MSVPSVISFGGSFERPYDVEIESGYLKYNTFHRIRTRVKLESELHAPSIYAKALTAAEIVAASKKLWMCRTGPASTVFRRKPVRVP